jgi:hypothetical protein
MSNTTKVVLAEIAVLVLGFAGGYVGVKVLAPVTGGDFAGGIPTSNLFTGSASGGSVDNVPHIGQTSLEPPLQLISLP